MGAEIESPRALRRALARERRAVLLKRLAIGPTDLTDLATLLGSITQRELLSLLRTMRQQGLTERGDGDIWRATGRTAPLLRKTGPQGPRRPSLSEPFIRCVPAEQIGMHRDILVAALFGPRGPGGRHTYA